MDIQATPADIERLLSQSDWLRALARRLVGDGATADDLVQETWIAALLNPPDPDRPVRPWLAGVLRRVLSMRARSEGRRAWRQRRAAKRDELPSTSKMVEEVDTQQRLTREVLELDEPYRTTVLLRYFHDLSAAEIARRQGVPAGTVRWRLKRGLDDLRARLDRNWGERRAWSLALLDLARRAPTAPTKSAIPASLVAAGGLAALGATGWLLLGSVGGLDDSGPAAVVLDARAVRPVEPAPSQSTPALGPSTVRRGTSAPAAVASDASLQLLVQDPAGLGVSGSRGLVLGWGTEPLAVTFDAGGATPLPQPGAATFGSDAPEVWIERPGSFLARAPLPAPEPGEPTLRITLPWGADLVGRLLHDGVPIEEPLVLQIDSDRMLESGPPPPVVQENLDVGRRATTTTDGQGRFRFHSLPANWSGELWLPKGWRVAAHEPRAAGESPAADRLHLDSLLEEHVIELARMPSTRGVIVTSSGEPAAGARVRVRAEWSDGRSAESQLTTDAAGAFALDLARCDLARLAFEVQHESGWRHREFVRRNPDQAIECYDVGVINIEENAAGTSLLVVGPDGPVAGAWFLPRRGQPTGPSDSEGRLILPRSGSTGWIGAPGYRARTFELARGDEAPRVTLEPTNRLELAVVDALGRPLEGVALRLVGGAPGADPPPRLRTLLREGAHSSDGRAFADAAGRTEWFDLPADVPLAWEVLDVLGRPLETVQVEALGAGDAHRRTVTLRTTTEELAGTCVDERGDVLVGVTLYLTAEGRAPVRVRSSLDGQFRRGGLGPRPVDIRVQKRGFVEQHLQVDPRHARALDLRMETAVDLVVEPLQGGAAVEEGRFAAHRLSDPDAVHGWVATEFEPGRYLFQDLPREQLVLAWRAGEREGTCEWDPTRGAALLDLDAGVVRAR